MVFVFVWLPKKKGGATDIGHGAMQVNGSYVSNWPGQLRSIIYGPGQAAPSFDDDKSSEHGLPQLAFKLKGLDEDAMEDKWDDMKKNLTYSFATNNCFTTVGTVLAEGLSGAQSAVVNTIFPTGIIVVHAALITYVQAVSIACEGKFPVNLMSGKNVFAQAYDELMQAI